MGDKEMLKWLKNYEQRRTNLYRSGSGGGQGWHSSKFDLESKDWDYIKESYVPELDCTFAQACNYLKKSWKRYKRLRREGGPDRGWDVILTINRIQRSLGLELIEFNDGPSLDWVKAQLDAEERSGPKKASSEALEAKYEQDQEENRWGPEEDSGPGSEEEDSDIPDAERALYVQLRKEERTDQVNRILEQLGIEPAESSEETDEY